MALTPKNRVAGFTLLELTLAVAIFAVVIGVTAQSLISFYATMETQDQRVVAANHIRGLINDMRSLRDANPNTSETPTAFQDAVLETWPNDTTVEGPEELEDSQVTFTYEQGGSAANPLVPTVTITWQDLRGRAISESISSALTDR